MSGTVTLLINNELKKIRIQRDNSGGVKTWIVKMSKNNAFVMGEVDDGSFAAGNLYKIAEAKELGLEL